MFASQRSSFKRFDFLQRSELATVRDAIASHAQ
jgi:hypothetical protein